MQVANLKRKFIFNDMELTDIHEDMSPKEVMEVYSNTYPELNNGNITGPVIKDDVQVFTFKTVLGSKGRATHKRKRYQGHRKGRGTYSKGPIKVLS